MTRKVLIAGAIAVLLNTSAAHSATITNRGADEIKFLVTEGASRQERMLPAGKSIEGVCQKGCIIRLDDSENGEYELNGSDRVFVEEGVLYYESSSDQVAPTGGSDLQIQDDGPK